MFQANARGEYLRRLWRFCTSGGTVCSGAVFFAVLQITQDHSVSRLTLAATCLPLLAFTYTLLLYLPRRIWGRAGDYFDGVPDAATSTIHLKRSMHGPAMHLYRAFAQPLAKILMVGCFWPLPGCADLFLGAWQEPTASPTNVYIWFGLISSVMSPLIMLIMFVLARFGCAYPGLSSGPLWPPAPKEVLQEFSPPRSQASGKRQSKKSPRKAPRPAAIA